MNKPHLVGQLGKAFEPALSWSWEAPVGICHNVLGLFLLTR